MSLLTMTLNEM